MADRKVTGTGKDADGDITSVCGSWGKTSKSAAIAEIETGVNRYYVDGASGSQVDVIVVDGDTGKYLRTDPDGSVADNLGELPDCK